MQKEKKVFDSFIPLILDSKLDYMTLYIGGDTVRPTELRCYYGVFGLDQVLGELNMITEIYPKASIGMVVVKKDGTAFRMIERCGSKKINELMIFFKMIDFTEYIAVMLSVGDPRDGLPIVVDDKFVIYDDKGNLIYFSKKGSPFVGYNGGCMDRLERKGYTLLSTYRIQEDMLKFMEKGWCYA